MAILAGTVDGARRRRHPPRHPGGCRPQPGRWGPRQTATTADATGYRELLEFAGTQLPSDPARRCWAVQAPAATAPG